MKADNGQGKPSRFWLYLAAAALVTAPALIMQSFQGARAADGEAAVATYTRGVLHVTIPYHAPHAGAGQLTVEVLDPEDQGPRALGAPRRRERRETARGSEDVQLAKARRDRGPGLASRALSLRLQRCARTRRSGHGIHLADPAHAGDPHPRTAVLSGRRHRRRCA